MHRPATALKVVEEVKEKVQGMKVNEKMKKSKGMENSRSKRYAHFMCGHDMRAQDRLDPSDAMCES